MKEERTIVVAFLMATLLVVLLSARASEIPSESFEDLESDKQCLPAELETYALKHEVSRLQRELEECRLRYPKVIHSKPSAPSSF